MRREFTVRKRVILGGLVLLILADVTLAAYSWHLSSAPRAPQQDLALQNRQRQVLQADIERAQNIRKDIPNIQKDCDAFEHSLFPESTGYSAVSAELGALARKAGLFIEERTLKQKELSSRGLVEIAIDATVAGQYPTVIHFLNGLQRSKDFYEVDALTLATDSQNQAATGPIKVSLHMKTYFRAGS